MSITASEMTPADIAAVTNNRGGNGGDGWGDGNSAWWIIILFLFAFAGGWGNGYGGGNAGGGGATPYIINTGNEVQRGFDQAAIMGSLNDISIGICNGFSGVNATVNNGFAQAEIGNNARQMANMQQLFGLQSQFADCCCENRLATANLGSAIASEIRGVIENQTANTQAILDKLCQQEIDALKTQNANLQTQVNLANLRESQTAQTAQILADNAAQTVAVEQYLNPAPIPAYVVSNPNGCGCNTCGTCGCGM